MYKHPEINYQPQHPTLQDFESAAWNPFISAKEAERRRKHKDWLVVSRKTNSRNNSQFVKEMHDFADKYYKNVDGSYRYEGSRVNFKTWLNYVEYKLNRSNENPPPEPPEYKI